MKTLALVLGLLAFASAEIFTGEIDWSTVRPIEDFPHYWTRIPRDMMFEFTRTDAQSRVTNGKEAAKHQFPFQVSFLFQFPQGQGLCGGSVLSNNYLLTAGHCVDGASGGTAILGAHNIRDSSEDNLKIKFDKSAIKQHEWYNPLLIRNDLAIIKLPEPIEFNEKIQPIQLPSFSDVEEYFVGEISTVSGWGRFSDDSQSTANILRYVSNPVLANDVCAKTFGSLLVQTQNICMDSSNGGSACNGDSGGPLTIDIFGARTQVGVVSFGSAKGCEKGFPAVFARVTHFLKWIQQNSDVEISS